MVVGISCPASESARPFLSTQFCLPVHHSGGGGTLDQAVAPVAGETESGCGLWLGKPELGERGDIWRTEPMGRAVLINGPPTSTIRSLGPVNFHGCSLPRSRGRRRTDSVSPAKGRSTAVVNHPGYSANTSRTPAFSFFRMSPILPNVTLCSPVSSRYRVEAEMPS